MESELINILGLIVAGLACLVVLYWLLRYPEVSLALFVAAYVLKGGINTGILNLTVILLVVAALGFVLPVLAGKKRIRFQIAATDLWLWVFMSIWVAGILYSPSPALGIRVTFRVLAVTITPYLLARIFVTKPQQMKRFLIALFASALVISLLFVVGAGVAHSNNRMIFLEANPIPEASLLAMGFLIAVIGAAEGLFQNRWVRRLSLGSSPILIYGILLTGSRGPLVSVVLAMVFYFAVTSRRRARLMLRTGFALVVLGIVIMSFGILPDRIATRYNPLNWADSTSVEQRMTLYQSIWQRTQQNPLIGLGTGSVIIAENIFLEVYANVGIIGLLCFLAFLYSIARRGIRYLVRVYPYEDGVVRGIGLVVVAVAVALFMDKQVSYALDGNKDLFIFLGLIVNLLPVMNLYASGTDTKHEVTRGLRG